MALRLFVSVVHGGAHTAAFEHEQSPMIERKPTERKVDASDAAGSSRQKRERTPHGTQSAVRYEDIVFDILES